MPDSTSSNSLLVVTRRGLYCPHGDFFIDPTRKVERAVITHAHSDHAIRGHRSYLTSCDGEHVLRTRIGAKADIRTLAYGDRLSMQGVTVSLHPAGHILGSSQVRVEYRGEVWVASGDYKLEPEPTCQPFEPVRCHTFITESTFALPIYRWPPQSQVIADINHWWSQNALQGRTSILFGYSLGKTQHVLSGLDPAIGPIFCELAVERMNADYRLSGVHLPPTRPLDQSLPFRDAPRAMVIATPTGNHGWLSQLTAYATAFASGWTLVRKTARRQAVDRGFVLSDHADWPGLLQAIALTGAERVLATHGYVAPLVRWLNAQGLQAAELR